MLLHLLLLLLHSLQLLEHLFRSAATWRDDTWIRIVDVGDDPLRSRNSGLTRNWLVLTFALLIRRGILVFLRLGLRWRHMKIILRRGRSSRIAGRAALRQQNDFLHASGMIGITQNHVVKFGPIQQAGKNIFRFAWPKPGDYALASRTGRHVHRSARLRLHRAHHLRKRCVLRINAELAILIRHLWRRGRLLLECGRRRRNLRRLSDWHRLLAVGLGSVHRGRGRLERCSLRGLRGCSLRHSILRWNGEAGQQQQGQPDSSLGA